MITNQKKESFQQMDIESLNNEILKAGRKGNLESVQYLLTSPELKKYAEIHDKGDILLKDCCEEGQFEIVKYIVELEEDSSKFNNRFLKEAMSFAIINNHNEIFYYLLDHPNFKTRKLIDIDFLSSSSNFMRYAVKNNNESIFTYLLNLPEIKDAIHYQESINLALNEACEHNIFNIIKTIMETPELKEQVDTNFNQNFKDPIFTYGNSSTPKTKPTNYTAFAHACYNENIEVLEYLLQYEEFSTTECLEKGFLAAFEFEKNKTLEYLIMEYKIPYSDKIKDRITKEPVEFTTLSKEHTTFANQDEIVSTMRENFRVRDFHIKLDNALHISIEKEKKKKKI